MDINIFEKIYSSLTKGNENIRASLAKIKTILADETRESNEMLKIYQKYVTNNEKITKDEKQLTKNLFANTSKVYEFSEDYLDIFLALTSSGPAIIALIIEALSDGGLSGGLPKILSEELVLEMIVGTTSLIKENKLTTSELKNLVTSPGGTTISALRVLEKKSVRSALIESIVSASNRSKEFR